MDWTGLKYHLLKRLFNLTTFFCNLTKSANKRQKKSSCPFAIILKKFSYQMTNHHASFVRNNSMRSTIPKKRSLEYRCNLLPNKYIVTNVLETVLLRFGRYLQLSSIYLIRSFKIKSKPISLSFINPLRLRCICSLLRHRKFNDSFYIEQCLNSLMI